MTEEVPAIIPFFIKSATFVRSTVQGYRPDRIGFRDLQQEHPSALTPEPDTGLSRAQRDTTTRQAAGAGLCLGAVRQCLAALTRPSNATTGPGMEGCGTTGRGPDRDRASQAPGSSPARVPARERKPAGAVRHPTDDQVHMVTHRSMAEGARRGRRPHTSTGGKGAGDGGASGAHGGSYGAGAAPSSRRSRAAVMTWWP